MLHTLGFPDNLGKLNQTKMALLSYHQRNNYKLRFRRQPSIPHNIENQGVRPVNNIKQLAIPEM